MIQRWKEAAALFSPFNHLDLEGRQRNWKETKILPLWYGTSKSVADSIADSGFIYFGKTSIEKSTSEPKTTEEGFFGNGIYFTNSARYASDIYSSGHILMAWVSMREPFPVVGDPDQKDMKVLRGKGAYKDYNAHYIPVTSSHPSNAYEAVYYPTREGESPHCDEVVVFNQSQTMPRFWIELQVESPYLMTPSITPLFVKDFIPHLFKLLENPSVDSDKKLRNYLGEELAILLKLKGNNRLKNYGDKYETLYKQLTQLIDVQGKVNQQISRILIGTSAQQAVLSLSSHTSSSLPIPSANKISLTSTSISNSFYSIMIDKTAKLNQLKPIPVIEFIAALHREPHQAALYGNLALILASNESVKLPNGTSMTEQQLYLKAIDLDPSYSSAYYNLGNTLAAGTNIYLLKGICMTKQQLFLKTIDLNPNFFSAYNNLGNTLSVRANIQLLNGTHMDQQQLYLKAIDLNPNYSIAYYNLGNTLAPEASIQLLNGTRMTKQQLFLKAIDLDPDFSAAYNNLGNALAPGASIQLLNGTIMDKLLLYLKAIDLNSNNFTAYHNLGAVLPPEASVILLNYTRMTQQQLFLKAIDLNPNFSIAYSNLGATLLEGASIQLLNGSLMTPQQLYLKAIDLDPNFSIAYRNLGITLAAGASIQLLSGTRMTQQQLYLKAIDLDPNYANAYVNLGKTLTPGASIQLLSDTLMNQQQLYHKAIDLNPDFSEAYDNFGSTLVDGASIQLLNGNYMTKK